MESKTKIVWGGWADKLKDDDDDGHVEFSLEDWEPEEVYKTAYKQSHIDYIQTWD